MRKSFWDSFCFAGCLGKYDFSESFSWVFCFWINGSISDFVLFLLLCCHTKVSVGLKSPSQGPTLLESQI